MNLLKELAANRRVLIFIAISFSLGMLAAETLGRWLDAREASSPTALEAQQRSEAQ